MSKLILLVIHHSNLEHIFIVDNSLFYQPEDFTEASVSSLCKVSRVSKVGEKTTRTVSRKMMFFHTIQTFNDSDPFDQLPDNKILDWFKLKQIADDSLTLSQTTNFRLFQTQRVCRRQF